MERQEQIENDDYDNDTVANDSDASVDENGDAVTSVIDDDYIF